MSGEQVGNPAVLAAGTAMFALKTGDEYEIKLGLKQIHLVPVGGSDEKA